MTHVVNPEKVSNASQFDSINCIFQRVKCDGQTSIVESYQFIVWKQIDRNSKICVDFNPTANTYFVPENCSAPV